MVEERSPPQPLLARVQKPSVRRAQVRAYLHVMAELAADYCILPQLSVCLALAATVLAVCWRRSQLERNSLLEPGR